MIMIKKARMDELISQDACIYHIFQGDIYLVDLTMVKEYGNIGCYEYYNDYYNCNLMFNLSDEIFENREEAEWHKEFGNITRIETLKLPTWEGFDEEKFIWFVDKKQNQCCLYYLNIANKIFINVSGEVIEIGEFTKENYTLACRKCRELFLGGEDE